MGLSNFLADKIVKKVTGAETIRFSTDAMCELVKEHFIQGADDAFLESVRKTAKGNLFKIANLFSKNNRYELRVQNIQIGILCKTQKSVYVLDHEKNTFYQLDKDKNWKKFYTTIDNMIKLEKINRK